MIKKALVAKLMKEEGFIWIDKGKLLIWWGPDNLGALITKNDMSSFIVRVDAPNRLTHFSTKPRKELRAAVDTTLKEVMGETRSLRAFVLLDEKGRQWLKRVDDMRGSTRS